MKLLEPYKLKNLELRTHTVMTAMHLGYADSDGKVTERLIRFYVERAENLIGLIIIGGCSVSPMGKSMPFMISLEDDSCIQGLRKLTDVVHRSKGALIGAQLYHAGRYVHSFMLGGEKAWAPSAVKSVFTNEIPKEMTSEEIRKTIEEFGDAARRAKESGFDAVEILGSAGYLICQFLSPLTNKRNDEYGGSEENRMRFMFNVIKRVREVVGHGFPVIYRIAGDDFMGPESNTYKDIQSIAKAIADSGLIDVISVTGGWHETKVPQITMEVPAGAYVFLAEGIKAVTGDIPVIACNRINDPFLAEGIFIGDKADLIGMGRAFIADPEFLTKTMGGRYNEIRKCIGCNQGCLDRVFSGEPVECMVNARAGRESEFPMGISHKKKKVVVIGGGPGGMEAARVAAMQGHVVTLFEKDRLGGTMNLAAMPYIRQEFRKFRKFYEASFKELKVKIERRNASFKDITALSPDTIVCATGASPIKPPIPGINNKNVVTAEDVLKGNADTEKKVVIIGGSGTGCETAIYLAESSSLLPDADAILFLLRHKALSAEDALRMHNTTSKEITIIEMLPKIGQGIGKTTAWTIMKELHSYGISVKTETKAKKILDEGVIVEKNGEEKLIEADTVVIAVGVKPNDALYNELRKAMPDKEIIKVGDCNSPRTILEAVREGFETGYKV